MAIEGIDPYSPGVSTPYVAPPEESNSPPPEEEAVTEESTGTTIDTSA